MLPVICKQVQYNSQAYRDTVSLRYKILRKPLGLHFTDEQLLEEKSDFHLAAFYEDKLVACLILTKKTDIEIKMRQVAVDENLHGKGIGKKLVRFSEAFAKEKGFKLMTLNARETAVPFYLSLNYNIKGHPFTEVGLKHNTMYKNLI